MKKILTVVAMALMSLGVVSANEPVKKKDEVSFKTLNYADFVKENPSIKKFNEIPGLSFEKKYTKETLSKMGFFLDDFKSEKIDFYGYVNPNPEMLGVPVLGKTLLVGKDSNVVEGLLVEFEGNKTKEELFKKLSENFGQLLSEYQENEILQYFWGVKAKDDNLPNKGEVVSVILSFDIYNDRGSVAWINPKILFK